MMSSKYCLLSPLLAERGMLTESCGCERRLKVRKRRKIIVLYTGNLARRTNTMRLWECWIVNSK